jgi:hypothetical protein
MLMLFDSFQRSDAVMAALGAQAVEDLPHLVTAVDGSHAGHVHDYVLHDEFVATSVLLPKGSVAEWKHQANHLIAAHADARIVFIFHNEMPRNTREPPCSIINPSADTLVQATGRQAPLSDGERATLEKALQLRKKPARSRAGRDAELRTVFGGMSEYLTNHAPIAHTRAEHVPALMQELVRRHEDDDDEDQVQLAIAASLAETQPDPPARPLKRTCQEVLDADNPEPAVAGQPVCIACTSNRASICFISCGHQVMCAPCLRTWLEANPHCPMCRNTNVDVIRPHWSAAEK